MNQTFLYPQLNLSTAERVMQAQMELSLVELESEAALTHPDAAPAATGGHPVPTERLQKLQEQLREVAKSVGFPEPLGKQKTQSFDRPAGKVLYESMSIVPADAAEVGVWSFLSLVLVPEIGPWRFSDRASERLLGQPRNVLRRLWWRAWAFGPDLDAAPEGCQPLGEDEFVQVMERPSLGGNPRTARAIRDALWRAETRGLDVPRSDMMREMCRRLRAVRSHRSLDVLEDVQLADLLDGLAQDSRSHLRSG